MLSRRRESGQAIVLVAIAMSALLAMTALVLSAGQLFWERRQAQGIADAGALAGAAQIPCSGQNAYAAIDGVISKHLGVSPSLSQTMGACGPSASSWGHTYPDGTAVSVTYPYVNSSRIQVKVTRATALPLGIIFGKSSSAVAARAVGQNQGEAPPLNYAVYAARGITCGGTAPIDVKGSVYSGAAIDTNCSVYVHALPGDDQGDLLVYTAGQQWSRGGGSCGGGTANGNVICGDGYEISQSQCPSSPAVTDYLGTDRNDYPCPSWTVPAPNLGAFSPPEPNADIHTVATIGGTPCNPSGTDTYYTPLVVGGATVGRMHAGNAVINGLTVPNAPVLDASGYYHFRPGCYGWLDVSSVPTTKPIVFDPGFYYFGGYYKAGDGKGKTGPGSAGGLCMSSGGQAVGKDVLFEFTSSLNASSFSTSSCDAAPTSSTSGGFGANPSNPITDGATSYGYLSAPCDSSKNPQCPLPGGTSSWCPSTDRACNALLIWAPPGPPTTTLAAINGTFYAKGPSEASWLYGTVYWPGSGGSSGCSWSANASSSITGSLICQSVNLQGGSVSAGSSITYARSDNNEGPSQSGLVE